MTPRTFIRRAYHLVDRWMLSRLPESMQRQLLSMLLALVRRVRPSSSGPLSVDSLLARRVLRVPSKPMRTLPAWAVEDMQDLSLNVDPLLPPGAFLQSGPVARYAPTHWVDAGAAYQRILDKVGHHRFDTILLVPWLKRGGADLGALYHARLCSGELGQRTLVIATENSNSPWAGRLPQDVVFVDAGSELSTLSGATGEPEIVLARLLLQLAPGRIHIINSHTAWRMLERFGLAVRQQTRIFASLYCDELTVDGRADGLAQLHLPTTSHWLDAVITDNSASPESWARMLGIRRELFKVVHFPAPPVARAMATTLTGKRVLWASRLERQKRPELLLQVASHMQHLHWDIHGTALATDDPILEALGRLDNVTLHGPFDSFGDIVSSEHLAYVYTTAWDGLPNVLLEAANAGLPIVAPDIGGIRDLVPAQWLLAADAGAADYAQDIDGLLANANIRQQRLRAQDERTALFTWQAFANGMRRIDGYTRA